LFGLFDDTLARLKAGMRNWGAYLPASQSFSRFIFTGVCHGHETDEGRARLPHQSRPEKVVSHQERGPLAAL
jgi:hypothetical protein